MGFNAFIQCFVCLFFLVLYLDPGEEQSNLREKFEFLEFTD